MRAGFSSNVVLSCWGFLDVDRFATRDYIYILINKHLCFSIDWLIRTATLPFRGVPQGSFSVYLEARSVKAAKVWTWMKRIAAAREAIPRYFIDVIAPSHHDRRYLLFPYHYVWNLPSLFATVVKNIMGRTSIIQIDGPCSEPWTAENLTVKFGGWPVEKYERFHYAYHEAPKYPGGWLAHRNRYINEIPA